MSKKHDSKKNDTWMPLYIGDYLADTSRLSTEQHGAYLLILMDYWRNGPPLDDDEELANISKLPMPQWRKYAAKIRAMFTSADGRLYQKRADAERQKAGLVSSKRSEAGKQGAAKRWGKGDGKPIANGMANGMANAKQNDAPSQSQSEIDTSVVTPPLNAGAHDPPEIDGCRPTRQGLLCRRLRQMGIADVNPGHPLLLALLEAGATDEEFLGFVEVAKTKDRPFSYLLGAVEGERKRAADVASQIHRGPMPNRQEAIENRNRSVAQAWAEGS
jgi:uncharacterized protein YdaU (DUF1376 family)